MKKVYLSLIVMVNILLINIMNAYARAGGHSGGGHSSGGHSSSHHISYGSHSSGGSALTFKELIYIILTIVSMFIIYRFIKYAIKSIKNLYKKDIKKVSKDELRNVLLEGNIISDYEFQVRVSEVHKKVQESWAERDMEIANGYVSEKLYSKHLRKINKMKSQHKLNVLKKIQLDKCKILKINNKKYIKNDFIEVEIKGSMIDYWIKEDNTHISGSRNKITKYTEIWTFVVRDRKWVLHKISKSN